ncbi:oligosaccharide flippase family protein, partial [Candidatus Microgenomates bacterium]|nr:oligosaccharide flippase family protein [Candidatus Microgenomates bacterium]
IMAMNIAARILGLIKYLVLGHYFTDTERSLFLAAFFPSETLFEILVSGSLAAAFIPVFTSLFSKGEKERAWYVAGITQTTVFLIFSVFAVFTFIFADQLLGLVPNIPPEYSDQIVALTRFLLIVQIFFILSFTLGPIQETFGRFLVPAMAPLFYNLGIIAGIVFLHRFGLWGPAIGAAFGALMSFIFQYPFAKSLGFRFIPKVNLSNPDFRRVIALASPRMLELIATRAAKSVELFLAFMISTASYGFFVFANALQLIPVALFGYSFSRAAMPTLSAHVARGDRESFERTFGFAVGQVIFFTVPVAILLAVLRIPIVRIAFGAEKFSWEATVQTGYILSAFAIGLIAEGIREVLVRSFYARHDTRTPLVVSLISTVLYITGAYWLIRTVGVG